MRAAAQRRPAEVIEDRLAHRRHRGMGRRAAGPSFPTDDREAPRLEEGVGHHRHQRVPVQPGPGAAHEVVEAELLLHLRVRLLAIVVAVSLRRSRSSFCPRATSRGAPSSSGEHECCEVSVPKGSSRRGGHRCGCRRTGPGTTARLRARRPARNPRGGRHVAGRIVVRRGRRVGLRARHAALCRPGDTPRQLCRLSLLHNP